MSSGASVAATVVVPAPRALDQEQDHIRGINISKASSSRFGETGDCQDIFENSDDYESEGDQVQYSTGSSSSGSGSSRALVYEGVSADAYSY